MMYLPTNVPNQIQTVQLDWVIPSDENVRLFIEDMSLDALVDIYTRSLTEPETLLPDPPILRLLGWTEPTVGVYGSERPILEILAGERRITAAKKAGRTHLPCRVVVMTDDEAYKFILAHNDTAGVTTVELAYRATEMERLGFSNAEISEALNGASPSRYLTVGALVDPSKFTSTRKLCDPSIVEWFEAAIHGAEHFTECFTMWDAGLWDAETCSREFRKRGKALPIDNAEKGFRVTLDGNRFIVRGQIDLDIVSFEDAERMLDRLSELVGIAKEHMLGFAHFGPRNPIKINPETV